MKKLLKFSVLILFFLLIAIQSYANDKLGQTGLKILDISMSARSAALGDAYILLGNDANALFYNPAGIAKMESKFDFVVNYTSWIADIKYYAIGLAINRGNSGNFGFTAIYPDYGNIYGTELDPTDQKGYRNTGEVDCPSFAVGLSYARQCKDNKFMIGGQIKYIFQHLGSNLIGDNEQPIENEVSGFAFDFGASFYIYKSLGVGMSIRNWSSEEFKYYDASFKLPMRLSLAFGVDFLNLFRDLESENTLNIEIDVVKPNDYTERFHVGAEFTWQNKLTLRTGYKFNYDEEGLTFGVGFKLSNIKIDYAYSYFGVFDLVNRFSVGFSF